MSPDGDSIDLDPEQVLEKLRAGEIQLVDVREDHEHEAGWIPGSRHIPVAQLSEQAGTLDREKPVVFHCRGGGRSTMATQAFRAAGLEAYNLAGGIKAWAERGLPMEPEGSARVADH
jgi:rhodanese-related sulfurtransferase